MTKHIGKPHAPEDEPYVDWGYEDDDDDFDRCPYCKGTGYVNPLTAHPKHFCVGTTECEACDGTGRI